ncbi:MAG: hypothetical protein QXW69_07600 [Nitrososphaerota archaeon]
MKFKRFKLGKQEQEVLSIIFQTILATTAALSLAVLFSIIPNFPIALNFLLKHLKKKGRKIYPSQLKIRFEKMRRKRLIDIIEKDDGEITIILKENGIKYAIVNNIDKLRFKKPLKWDKIWRIIIFDIPEKYKNERNFFTQKLKQLNFYPLQKSVFVTPYPPHEITNFLSEFLNISPYVRIIEATKIEGEEEILAHFELKK